MPENGKKQKKNIYMESYNISQSFLTNIIREVLLFIDKIQYTYLFNNYLA